MEHKATRLPADTGILISKEDAHLLIAAEEQLRAEHTAESVGMIGRAPSRRDRRQLREYARLKNIDSRFVAHSGTLIHNAVMVTSPAGLEKVYTGHRGGLWTTPPLIAHGEEEYWLRAVRDIADQIDIGGIPTIDEIRNAIESSPDSAPGIDGVPYSFWRLVASWAAKVIQEFFYALEMASQDGWATFDPTIQMLIFIPPKTRRNHC